MEEECEKEKINLINLIKVFKDNIQEIIKCHKMTLPGSTTYPNLKNVFKDTISKLSDTDYFFNLIGPEIEYEENFI
jgi:hypothetical protein